MRPSHRRWWAGLAALLLSLAVGFGLVRSDIAQRRAAFLAEARTAHGLIGQSVAQSEVVLATLALNAAGDPRPLADLSLPPGFAFLQAAQRQAVAPARGDTPEPAGYRIDAIERSASQYQLTMRYQGHDIRLRVDASRWLQHEAWPWPVDGPVRVVLRADGLELLLQAGADETLRPTGWTEGFRWVQPVESQAPPFEFRAQRWTGPAEWPWVQLLLAALACSAVVALVTRTLTQRDERRRAAELQRLAQVSRLNTLGELAAGMAHELNQPLTAVLSGTQAALRVLRATDASSPADAVDEALPALELAAAQARRAADVVSRLRGLVKPPALGPTAETVDLLPLVRGLFDVLTPELRRRAITVEWRGEAVQARGDRVAVEQILHNLLVNAMQALATAVRPDRIIIVTVGHHAEWIDCIVADNGPGIAAEHQARIFEPFFTTRPEGLGLGLSLCQTLAQAMGGQLTVGPSEAGTGAAFCLRLPRASPTS